MKKFKIASLILTGALILGGANLLNGGFYKIYPNIHVVVKGEFYRSGRLSQKDLELIIKEQRIKTVINVRNGGDSHSKAEESFCKSNNIDYINIPLTKSPKESNIEKIMYEVAHAKKPVLGHCKVGASRIGLISAIYLFNSGTNAQDAKKQLSLKYLHPDLFYPQYGKAFEDYVKLQKFK